MACVTPSAGRYGPCRKTCADPGQRGDSHTARAAAEDLGAARITVVSRRGPVDYTSVYDLRDAGAVINTTPVGMFPNNGASPLDLPAFRA